MDDDPELYIVRPPDPGDGWRAAPRAGSCTSHGGWAPEQWRGSVDGHSFFFRERHDRWRIEVDLAPSGRFVEVWRGGDTDDQAAPEFTELDQGQAADAGIPANDWPIGAADRRSHGPRLRDGPARSAERR